MSGLVRHVRNLIEHHSFLLHLSKNLGIVSSWEKLHVLWPWWGMLLNTSGKGFIHPTGGSPNSRPRLLLSLSFPWESCNDSCGVEGLLWNVLSNMAGLGYVHSSGHDGWPRGCTSFRVGMSWKPQMVGRGGQSFVRPTLYHYATTFPCCAVWICSRIHPW